MFKTKVINTPKSSLPNYFTTFSIIYGLEVICFYYINMMEIQYKGVTPQYRLQSNDSMLVTWNWQWEEYLHRNWQTIQIRVFSPWELVVKHWHWPAYLCWYSTTIQAWTDLCPYLHSSIEVWAWNAWIWIPALFLVTLGKLLNLSFLDSSSVKMESSVKMRRGIVPTSQGHRKN